MHLFDAKYRIVNNHGMYFMTVAELVQATGQSRYRVASSLGRLRKRNLVTYHGWRNTEIRWMCHLPGCARELLRIMETNDKEKQHA